MFTPPPPPTPTLYLIPWGTEGPCLFPRGFFSGSVDAPHLSCRCCLLCFHSDNFSPGGLPRTMMELPCRNCLGMTCASRRHPAACSQWMTHVGVQKPHPLPKVGQTLRCSTIQSSLGDRVGTTSRLCLASPLPVPSSLIPPRCHLRAFNQSLALLETPSQVCFCGELTPGSKTETLDKLVEASGLFNCLLFSCSIVSNFCDPHGL